MLVAHNTVEDFVIPSIRWMNRSLRTSMKRRKSCRGVGRDGFYYLSIPPGCGAYGIKEELVSLCEVGSITAQRHRLRHRSPAPSPFTAVNKRKTERLFVNRENVSYPCHAGCGEKRKLNDKRGGGASMTDAASAIGYGSQRRRESKNACHRYVLAPLRPRSLW